jgi:hypothetical protein
MDMPKSLVCMRRVGIAWAAVAAIGACSSGRDSIPAGTIALTRTLAVAGSGDTVDLLRGGRPHIAPGGQYVVLPVASTRGSLAVYAADGRLDHVFAPRGQGPGEVGYFQGRPSITSIGFGPGDSLWIEDGSTTRVSIFSPLPAAHFARSFTASRLLLQFDVTSAGLLSSPFLGAPGFFGRTKAPARGATFSMVGVPARLFSWSGEQIADFGDLIDNAHEYDVFGPTILADSNHVWHGKRNKYEIDLIARGGAVERRIVRHAAWFPKDTSAPTFPWLKPSPPRMESISVGADGVLWVLITRGSRDWAKRKPAKPPVLKPGMPMSAFPQYRANDLFEGVLEALDSKSGTVLASKELSGDYTGFVAPGMLLQEVEDDSGMITLHVWTLSVVH